MPGLKSAHTLRFKFLILLLSLVSVFYSYAHQDESLCKELEKHLSLLRREGIITEWYDRQILAGTNWEHAIDAHLMTASVILLLISPDFMASDYCYSIKMQRALQRHATHKAHVIPIILRPVDWHGAPFGELQYLPLDGKPVTTRDNLDEAFLDVARGIRKAIEFLKGPLGASQDSASSAFTQHPSVHFSTERARLVDLYLKNVVATTKQLPWGYLPGDFASELEIDDVYVLPRLSSKEHHRVNVGDEWLEREYLRQFNQSQEKEENHRRPVLKAEKSSYSSLYEIVQSGANATFLGYMGSGKSMAASYIALRLAKGEGQSIFGLARSKIPILLRLGRMRETPASDLITFAIENAIANLDHARALKDILRQEWHAGNVLLLLDALDEFGGDMAWISEQIGQLVHRDLHGSSVLLTSRPGVYRSVSVRLVGLKALTLEELQREEIFEFVEKWTKAILKIGRRSDVKARDHAKSLTHEIERHPFVLQEIASNQLLLTVLTILNLHPGGIRLERVTEAGLLDTYVTYLIDWEKSKGAEVPEKYGTDLLRIVFAYTGFEVQRAQSGMFDGICTKSTLLQRLSQSKYFLNSSGTTAEAILEFWLNTGLIQQTDDVARSIRFRHQAFQYFGAALAMTYQSEERVAEMLADVKTNPEWDDVCRLYIGLKAHPQPLLE